MERLAIVSMIICFLGSMLFIGCGKDDDDNGTGPSSDTEAPTVTITSPASGYTTSGSVIISVEATDNEEVSKVELLVDGSVKSTDTTSPYSFNIDFSSYSEGAHSVVAKAYDSSDNTAVSDAIIINYEYDFAPSGDGYIKAEIIHYIEDGTLDALSDGDPYFIFKIVAGNDSTTVYSETFDGRFELWNPYFYEYNVDDNTKDFSVSVWVYDEDTTVDEWVDYTPDSGFAYRFNLNTQTLPFEQTYNGSDDGIPSEPDCELQLRVSITTH
ncbi:hypothetical protein DRQ36_10955 [bacterium]|nr:MAG: hypothetical protein DRQ36_10955 [bacterium]